MMYCLNAAMIVQGFCTYAIVFLVFSFVSFFVVVFVVDAVFCVFFFALDLQNIDVNQVIVARMVPYKILSAKV